jgi:hypothetical protein
MNISQFINNAKNNINTIAILKFISLYLQSSKNKEKNNKL